MLCEVVAEWQRKVYLEEDSAWQRHRTSGRNAVRKSRMETGRGSLRTDNRSFIKQFDFHTQELRKLPTGTG